jgi:hypothetical protein
MRLATFRACLVAALLSLAPAAVIAKTHLVPEQNPIITVTIPDSWEVLPIPGGIEVTTEDEEYYFAIEVTNKRAAERDFTSSIAWLMSKGVKIDESSQKEVPFSINGMDGFMLIWNGTDEDGPTQVSVSLTQITENRLMLVTGWGTEQAQKDNMEGLLKMMESLKKIQ